MVLSPRECRVSRRGGMEFLILAGLIVLLMWTWVADMRVRR